MVEVVQPGGNRSCRRFAQPQAARLSHQHLHRAPLLPRHLFPATRTFRMAENDRRKPAHDFQASTARSHFWVKCRRAACCAPTGARTAALKAEAPFAERSSFVFAVRHRTTTRNGNEDLYRTRLPSGPYNPDWESTSPQKSNPAQTQAKARVDTGYVAVPAGKTGGTKRPRD